MDEDKLLGIISGQLTTLIILILGLFVSILFRPTVTVTSNASTIQQGMSKTTESIMMSDVYTEVQQVRESDIRLLSKNSECTINKEVAENAALISSTRQFKEFLTSNYIYDYNTALLKCKSSSNSSMIYTFIVANTDIAFDVDVDVLGGCVYSEVYNVLNSKYPTVLFIQGKPESSEFLYKSMLYNGITGLVATDYIDGDSSCAIINVETGKSIKRIDV